MPRVRLNFQAEAQYELDRNKEPEQPTIKLIACESVQPIDVHQLHRAFDTFAPGIWQSPLDANQPG